MNWVSCKEKMPQKHGSYIVTENWYSCGDRQHKGSYTTRVSIAEYDDDIKKFRRAVECEVIAWMEFPKPYKQ